MLRHSVFRRIISLLLVFALLFSLSACSTAPTPVLSDPNSPTFVENTEKENILTETVLTEFITTEIYLEEIIIAENKITELLLEEETITEVILCKSIYVPQANIEEFAANSQTAQLFGDDIDIKSLLTKVAVGTGIIVTVTVLKKAGLPDPVASVVVAAADKALQFGGSGAVAGSLLGGMMGAADEIDETGRTSAIIGFATATAGLIISIVSLVTMIPSGGSTTITAVQGIKLVLAGMGLLAATGGTAQAGLNAVKTFTSTDAADIDWDNINWDEVGASAAEKAIAGAADGYMWGAIVGTVYGGLEGYEYYQKHGAPYSTEKARIDRTPVNGDRGKWSGERGNSDFVLDEPITLADGTKITKITYQNGIPDFSPFQKAQVKIPSMTDNRYTNFKQADTALAEYWTRIKHNGKTWTQSDVANYRTSNNLTWHEMNNMEYMQLVPSEVNSTFGHLGGVGEYNAMIGQNGGSDFD